MTRANELLRIRAEYDAVIRATKASENTPGDLAAVGILIGSTVTLLGDLIGQVADLDEEVTALRKKVKRLTKAAE